MSLLDCLSYFKCCCDGKPLLEIDDVRCCNNCCCRDRRRRFYAFKAKTWAYLVRHATF